MNKERVIKTFMDYVQMDSPTTKEKEFAEFLMGELKSLGLEVRMDGAGEKVGSNSGNIIAKLKGTKDVEPILFSCHMDTVYPSVGVKPQLKDGVITSDGTTILGADNKAGIAAVMEALRTIPEEGIEHGLIEVVFSIYEEGGLLGAKNLEYDKLNSKRGFVLDSGGDPGEIIIQGPAQDHIEAKVIGKSAHAGVSPEEGVSAIQVAAHAISKMNLLRIDKDTTANIGVIQGGEATNIVTPEVTLKGEARSQEDGRLKAQTDHMVKCLEETAKEFGAKVEIKTERMYNSFTIDEKDEIVGMVKKACGNIGLEAYTTQSGGGSDTNILNSKGIKAINLGIGERKPHTLEEYIYTKDLYNSARLVLEIIKSA